MNIPHIIFLKYLLHCRKWRFILKSSTRFFISILLGWKGCSLISVLFFAQIRVLNEWIYSSPSTQSPTQKEQNRFFTLKSRGIVTILISFWMISKALQTKLLKFKIDSLGWKISKSPEFYLSMRNEFYLFSRCKHQIENIFFCAFWPTEQSKKRFEYQNWIKTIELLYLANIPHKLQWFEFRNHQLNPYPWIPKKKTKTRDRHRVFRKKIKSAALRHLYMLLCLGFFWKSRSVTVPKTHG